MARDLRLDSIRGLLLAQIAFVHATSPLAPNVTEAFGRVSTAAGFIFISGVVGGAVYSRIAERGSREILSRSIRRAGQIHSYHITTYLLLLTVTALLPIMNGYFRFAFSDPLISAWQTTGYFSVLMYQPRFFDILPIYTVFVLFMPLALIAFRRGWTPLVFVISLAVWILAQFPAGNPASWGTNPSFRLFAGAFNPLAWQLVFFAGLYLGHMHLYRKIPVVRSNPTLLAASLLIFVLGLTLRWDLMDWPSAFDSESILSDKRDFGLAYLVNCTAFFYLILGLARRYPRCFVWPPFAFLGQHSLQVFSFHIFMVYMLQPLFWRAQGLVAWGHDLLALLLVCSLFIPAALHVIIRRHLISRREEAALRERPPLTKIVGASD